jgi:deoxyribonuclease-4
LYEKSVNSFTSELIRTSQLGIGYLVADIGSDMGNGKENGIKQLVKSCEKGIDTYKSVYKKKLDVTILLQNGWGSVNSLGSRLEDLGEILDRLPSKGFGICLDTCRVFVSGYDLKSHDACVGFIEEFDKIVNLSKLEFIHLNDSKAEVGSGLDNHEYVGLGKIGLVGFKTIINHKPLRNLPMIMEPYFVSIEDYSKKLREMLELRD